MNTYTQAEYVGAGTLASLGLIMEETKAQRIIIVKGNNSYESSGASLALEKMLSGKDAAFISASNLPRYEEVLQGITQYESFKPDLVVAVGGGSVIDVAKAMNVLAYEKETDRYIEGTHTIEKPGKPLVAIPTTAGSGSEATSFAVIYKDGQKYSLSSPFILPMYAIVDPTLTMSVPRAVATASALDALVQSVESYWSTQSTEESRVYSLEALKILVSNLESAIVQREEEAMREVSRAAHLAGKAINLAKTTACHAFSYGLSYHFKVPHGLAVALWLPAIYVYNSGVSGEDCNDARGVMYVQKGFETLNRTLGVSTSEEAGRYLKGLIERLAPGLSLRGMGVMPEDIPLLLGTVNVERLSNNPRIIRSKDVATFYQTQI